LQLDTNQDPTTGRDYVYDDTFFRYLQQGSTRSAESVVPLVIDQLQIRSILDVGCGAGAWLAEYRRLGLRDCVGVDGDYVNPSSLLIPTSAFMPQNIAEPFSLARRFDLVQCLEVGEHLPPAASSTLVKNLVAHSDMILFSAAIPGQGGENHINEQPYEFWRGLFAEHGYSAYDFLRPMLRGNPSVEIWYRHNTMLYVADAFAAQLPASVAATRIPAGKPIPDVSSTAYRIRTRMLANLSVESLTRIAILKHKWLNFVRGRKRAA
jgi:SAM-dependent methyltransferase